MKTTFAPMFRLIFAACALLSLVACDAKKPEAEPDGITQENHKAGKHKPAPVVSVDLGSSELYTEKERNNAILAVRSKFATFAGCELHSIRYAGDEANSAENLEWLNSLVDGAEFTQVAEFLTDFHSPVEDGEYAWERDSEYRDYQWWLARKDDGAWVLVSWGY